MLNNNKKQETLFFGTKCGNANSIAAGYATETTNYGEIATGILNKSTKGDNPNSPEGVVGDPKATLFSVGCGTKEDRKNALEVKGDGSVIISGKDGSDVYIGDLKDDVNSLQDDVNYLTDNIDSILDGNFETESVYPTNTGSNSLKNPSLGHVKGNYIVSNGSLGKPAHNYDKLFVKNIYWSDRTDLFDPETYLNTGYWISAFRLFAKEGYKGRPTIYTLYRVYDNLEEGSQIGIYTSEGGRDITFFTDDHDSEGDNAYFRFNFMTNCIEHSSWGESEDCIFGNGVRYNAKKKIPATFVDLSTCVKSDEIYQCIKKDYDSSKRGDNSIAIDDTAIASGNFSVAIGNNAQATAKVTIALGHNAQAKKDYSVVLGYDSKADNYGATALGRYSVAAGWDSIAITNGQAVGDGSVAIGAAMAKGNYSVALGFGAITNTISRYALGGYDDNKQEFFNLEEITYSQYGNKKYLIGLGGYNGKNLTVKNNNVETLNPNIKSVQEIINGKADITPIIASTDAAITLQPNKKYEITAGDTLTLTLTEPSDKTHKNEYLFSINTGSSVSTIAFPIEIIWDVEPVISANKHYEINVQYSQGKYWGTVRTWNIPS